MVKQPKVCSDCGSKLMIGECGKGYCQKCRTYVMKIEIKLVEV